MLETVRFDQKNRRFDQQKKKGKPRRLVVWLLCSPSPIFLPKKAA
jgi:hypothetical protein